MMTSAQLGRLIGKAILAGSYPRGADCAAEKVLIDFVAGNMRPAQAHIWDRHIASCRACLQRCLALVQDAQAAPAGELLPSSVTPATMPDHFRELLSARQSKLSQVLKEGLVLPLGREQARISAKKNRTGIIYSIEASAPAVQIRVNGVLQLLENGKATVSLSSRETLAIVAELSGARAAARIAP